MKVDRVVVKETRYLALAVVVCSLIMQAVFLLLKRYDWTVLWGSLLGGGAAIANFWFLGLSVQKATAMEDPADAKRQMRASYSMRYFALIAIVVIGVVVPVFHWLAVALSLVFPRLWFLVMPILRKDVREEAAKVQADSAEQPQMTETKKEDEDIS